MEDIFCSKCNSKLNVHKNKITNTYLCANCSNEINNIKNNIKCEICGTYRKVYKYRDGKYYCTRHKQQITKHGYILERGRADKNKFVEYDDYIEIILNDRYGNENGRAIIDKDDKWVLDKYTFFKFSTGYAVTKIDGKRYFLHNILINIDEVGKVDHKDRNRLNCRRSNLRYCDKQLNSYNQSKRSDNTSGVTGVYWHSYYNKWKSTIQVNKKRIDLGMYDNIEKAKIARLDAEKKYFGEFSPQYKKQF